MLKMLNCEGANGVSSLISFFNLYANTTTTIVFCISLICHIISNGIIYITRKCFHYRFPGFHIILLLVTN